MQTRLWIPNNTGVRVCNLRRGANKTANRSRRPRAPLSKQPAAGKVGLKKVEPPVVISPTHWSSLHSYFLIALATVVCLLPFSGKAFHVDDTLFLWAAQQIAKHPLDPYGFRLIWDNTQVSMADVTQNPPLASYYAALIGRIAGWSERALHLGFLLPTLALVLGTYRLAQRLTSSPSLSALVKLFTPGAMVSASSVMCDTMMLAIWVWAAILWLTGMESTRPWYLTASSLLIAAAALTKYFGAALILLLLVYTMVRERRMGRWALYLLIPATILLAYEWWSTELYGHGLMSAAAAFAESQRSYANASLFAKALVGLSFAGGCALPALFLAPFAWSGRQCISGAVLSGIAAAAIISGWVNLGLQVGGDPALAVRRQLWLPLTIELSLCIAGGVSVLGLAAADYWKERSPDSLFLTLWVVGTFAFAAFVNYAVNARSVLPLVPAVGILLARRVDRHASNSGPRRIKLAFALLLSSVLSFWVARADAELAHSGRRAAEMIRERTTGQGNAVWFEGHWGFQYYMESWGAQPLDLENPQASPGDFIAMPENNTQFRGIAPQSIASSEGFALPIQSGASTISSDLGAGFYSSYWGPFPFVFGKIPQERYEILRIARVYAWEPERKHLQEKLDFLRKTRQNLFADSK